ncbi:hypothetical protein AAC387_Pa02g1900 [Persea americana]
MQFNHLPSVSHGCSEAYTTSYTSCSNQEHGVAACINGTGVDDLRWRRDYGDRTATLVGALNFEGWGISKFESFLKKTTKMMQVQVEAVAREVENENESLTKELTRKLTRKACC